jgi:hypothetical protein
MVIYTGEDEDRSAANACWPQTGESSMREDGPEVKMIIFIGSMEAVFQNRDHLAPSGANKAKQTRERA